MANGIVLGGSLYCRKSASTSAGYYGKFSTGTVIAVKEHGDEWYQTTWTDSSTGYVKKDYVAKADDYVTVTGNNINVRSSSSTSGEILYQFDKGASNRVGNVTAGWVYVIPKARQAGWISATYLEKDTDASGGNGSGSTSTPSIVTSFSGGLSSLTDSAVNVRVAPDSSAEISDSLSQLQPYQFATFSNIGTTIQQQEWLYVTRNNTALQGYVSARFIACNSTNYNATVSASGGLNLRLDPSTSKTSITTLDNGSRVLVIGSISGWYRVATPKGTGWVANDYIICDE